jgi:c-di-GMP-binding flagellar brake protein YcgR
MGGPGASGGDWFGEFQKANAPAPTPPPQGLPPGADRRRHFRFEVDEASASLYRAGLLTLLRVGKTNFARTAIDLSEGGVRLLLEQRLPIGTRVRIRIHMEKYDDDIQTAGEVRWCFESARKAGEFYAGVRFDPLETSQCRKIALMKDWFTSPQYKAIRDTRIRQKKLSGFTFPK